MPYEYRVLKDYTDLEHDFDLVEGDIVEDGQFPEPDIPGRLIGRGVIEPADKKLEAKRLKPDVKSTEAQKRATNVEPSESDPVDEE